MIGRESELAAVERFVETLEAGPAALVVGGDAGIGKSMLWRAALGALEERRVHVLACRPAETEAGLSFVALADLLHDVSPMLLDAVAAPQRDAIRTALRLAEPMEALDRVALALGVLAVVSALASDVAVVMAVDDAQWVDAPSGDVFRFLLRRLDRRGRVGVLATVRGEASPAPFDLEAALPPERVVRLVLGPLAEDEIEGVVGAQTGIELARPAWRTVHRVAAGNPLFALQIAEAVARQGGLAPGEAPPLPESVSAAVRARLASLSAPARKAILYAAAAARPTPALLRAAGADEGVDEALGAGLLALEGGRLRFGHPTFAAGIYAEAAADARLEVHRRLAQVVDEREERAVHLGRGSVDEDATVAAELEAAADRAAARGIPETAAELAGHAERLTPTSRREDAARRAVAAARYSGRAGDTERSTQILRRVAATLPAGRPRAQALALRGFITQDPDLLLRALDEADCDAELQAVAHGDVSAIRLRRGDRETAVAHARAAVAAAKRAGSPKALVEALTARALPFAYGRADRALALLGEAVALEQTLELPLSLINSPGSWRGALLLNVDRFDQARATLEQVYNRGLALGHASRVVPLTYLVELECREGNLEQAHRQALEATSLWAEERGVASALIGQVLVEAHRGDARATRSLAGRCIEGLHGGNLIALSRAQAALGMLELSLGNYAAAHDVLSPLVEAVEDAPLRDATAFRGATDMVEALLGLGRTTAAEALAVRLDEVAREVALPSRRAAASRSLALVRAELGDEQAARAAIADAESVHRRHHEPLEQARTLLAAGSIERRAKRKAAARDALRRAHAELARLGAERWKDRADDELARTGLRRTAKGDLSSAERRVCELAAQGATNKQIAAELFMSVKTVEAHLTRAYRKLGIKSRAELASATSDRFLPRPES